MKTSKKIEIARGLLHSGKKEVAQLLAVVWQDSMVMDYVAQHLSELDLKELYDPDYVKVLACHGIMHFMDQSIRADGPSYWHWLHDTPNELRWAFNAFVQNDDWRYEKLYDFAEAYIEGDMHEPRDSAVDIYHSDLLAWLNAGRYYYVEQAEREMEILHNGGSLFDLLQQSQLLEIYEMHDRMELCLDVFIEDHVDMEVVEAIVNTSREALEAV